MTEQQFCIGEYVESISDPTQVGFVRKVILYEADGQSGFLYHIRFGNDKADVPVTQNGLRSYIRIHAHVETESCDCDGRYTSGHTDVPNTDERTSQFGDILFKERVVCSVMSLHSTGTFQVTPQRVFWNEQTDEGYRHAEITWCDDDGCVGKSWQRDHSAEAAGY